ncbi:HNH endonuclease [uncultured Microbacterium sp.]|uniref:HNH endonuclease n=1 Tax=uncultured Microbacterium sp. TaxID=191216 RepID=UPI0028E5880F|nr:HNH endonuclease [uncultured Microbacterium sp.]
MVRRNTAMQDRMRQHVRHTGGNCRLCGEPIDYDIPYFIPGTRKPNPEAYVADHIIPIDKGGRHDTSNAQPAHWKCNSKKRARLDAPIIKRSGALN